jgi:uncharacterized protein YbcI
MAVPQGKRTDDSDDSAANPPAPDMPGESLTRPDWTDSVDVETGGSLRMAVSNAMVGLKKRFYGKGPVKARTFLNENYVFCVMEGGLTRNEETLLEAGEDEIVRDYRLKFQAVMAKPTMDAIEQITHRRVLGYHSQIVFRPERSFEIFVLDGPPGNTVRESD